MRTKGFQRSSEGSLYLGMGDEEKWKGQKVMNEETGPLRCY